MTGHARNAACSGRAALLIGRYLSELAQLRQISGSRRESVLREAFKDLLKAWGRQHDLVFVPEYELDTATNDRRYVDGALLHELSVPFGYWEGKDEAELSGAAFTSPTSPSPAPAAATPPPR